MKKYFILGLVFALFLSSCSIDWKDEGQNNELFKKKQECASYIPQVEKEFREWKSDYTE